jgi:tripartite-type tricarboxylate transporter receptor subunit TctC
MNSRRTWIIAAALVCAAGTTFAQAAFPSKPIRILVPNPAGGGTDTTARVLAEQLSKQLGQTVIVENKSGGNGVVAAASLLTAQPDGYTLLLSVSGIVQNPWLIKNLSYKLDQLAPVSLFTRIPVAFVVSTTLPVNSLQELIALAKAKPKTLSFASYGNGSSAHAYGELFNRSAGIHLLHVPYKGEQPALIDLLGGIVSTAFTGPGTAQQYEQTKKVKVLAVASAKRSPLLPNVPTFAEAGVPSIAEAGWSGFFVPAKTPKPIIDKLSHEIAIALQNPKTRAKISELMEPVGSTPEEFSAVVQKDYARWGEIFKSIGITPQ